METNQTLQKGSKGKDVIELQNLLVKAGFTIKPDGDFGFITEGAVKSFQTKHNLQSTGIVDYDLFKLLSPAPVSQPAPQAAPSVASSFQIIDKILEKGEYYEENTVKNTIVIHFTAGGYNPVNTIYGWDTDDGIDAVTKKKTARVVGTHFVVGGISNSNGDTSMDGKVYRAVPETGWIHHLGTKYVNNKKLNQNSFGIEVCNYGPIKLAADGKFYNYVNNVMPANMVTKLDAPFKGYTYYHDITDKQVQSLKELILYLTNKYPTIPLKTKLLDSKNYELLDDAKNGVPGIYVHTNYRTDKFDWPPIKKLTDMLNTICTKA